MGVGSSSAATEVTLALALTLASLPDLLGADGGLDLVIVGEVLGLAEHAQHHPLGSEAGQIGRRRLRRAWRAEEIGPLCSSAPLIVATAAVATHATARPPPARPHPAAAAAAATAGAAAAADAGRVRIARA